MKDTKVWPNNLTRAESLGLMSTATIGRIVFTEQALPAVLPAGFVLDGGDVVICAPPGSTLLACTRGAIVAFETDGPSADGRSVWSVTVVGRARVVRDPGERARRALQPWTAAPDSRFIRISCDRMTGRRIKKAGGGHRAAA